MLLPAGLITETIVEKTRRNLKNIGVGATIEVGSNHGLPFENNYFDYLLSWNSCYYLGNETSFDPVVHEFSHVLKPEGTLVMSIPKSSCFIYEGSDEHRPGYRIIRNDPYEVRNGFVLRMFSSTDKIVQIFSSRFGEFNFGSTEGDCFGLAYDWHFVICQNIKN